MFDREGNRKYLNQKEREAYFRVTEAATDVNQRTFSQLLFFTGCRLSEALAVTAGRVDFVEKTVTFRTLKQRRTDRFRSVPIPDSLADELAQLSQSKHQGERLWSFSRSTAWRIVKAHMRASGITGPKASPKGLRHGFAIASLLEKIPITTVKKWMGHTRLETTEIYLNANGAEERDLASRLWKAAGSDTNNASEVFGVFTPDALKFVANELVRMISSGNSQSVKQNLSDSVSIR